MVSSAVLRPPHGSVPLHDQQAPAWHHLIAAVYQQQHGRCATSRKWRSTRHAVARAAVAEHVQASLGKPSFVEVLRGAAPYVQSHRNSTCVVCLPSEVSTCMRIRQHTQRQLDGLARQGPVTGLVHVQVMIEKQLLNSVLADLVLLHSELQACELMHPML